MSKYITVKLTEDQLRHLQILLEFSIAESETNPFEVRLKNTLAKAKNK